MSSDEKNLFLFVHVAKTGGTTVRKFFAQALVPHNTFVHLGEPTYTQEKAAGLLPFAERTAEERAKAKVICGHDVTSRTHQLVPGKVAHYIAFLREPALRLISYYNFEMKPRRRKEQPVIDFEEWYQQGHAKNIMLGWLYRDVFGETSPRHVDRTVYKRVVQRLEDFWFVGCSEHLDRDFPLLLRFIGVSGTLDNANVSGVDYPKLLEPTEELRNRLNSDNELDFNLYAHFRDRLDERVRQLQASLDGASEEPKPAKDGSWLRRLLPS